MKRILNQHNLIKNVGSANGGLAHLAIQKDERAGKSLISLPILFLLPFSAVPSAALFTVDKLSRPAMEKEFMSFQINGS